MIFRFIAQIFWGIYFFLVSACLRLMASPHPIQIHRQKNEFSRLFVFFGILSPVQRKIAEIRINRYRSLFWGSWSLVFSSDIPLLQQTMNLSWFRFELRFAKQSGLQPSRAGNERVEAAIFLLHKLKRDQVHLENPSRRLRRRWKKYFTAAQIDAQLLEARGQSISQVVFSLMSSIMGLDRSEEIAFMEAHLQILAGHWTAMEPWKLAPLLKSKPEIWCWWLNQFPYDWAEIPNWTEMQKEVLFAVARWEISRGLVSDWKVKGFADEFKRLQLFFEKSFPGDSSPELMLIQDQLSSAEAILNTKNNSIV